MYGGAGTSQPPPEAPLFFFSSRRRHTRSDRDWSSDVCSSDLEEGREAAGSAPPTGQRLLGPAFIAAVAYVDPGNFATNMAAGARYGYLLLWVVLMGIGRASCRERGEISVGAGSIKKKKRNKAK